MSVSDDPDRDTLAHSVNPLFVEVDAEHRVGDPVILRPSECIRIRDVHPEAGMNGEAEFFILFHSGNIITVNAEGDLKKAFFLCDVQNVL